MDQLRDNINNLNTILEEAYPRIYKMCLFYLNNDEEARDMTQEVCFKITQKIETFRADANIKTWIFKITKNLLINYLKRKKIISFFSLEQSERPFEGKDTDPEQRLERDEESRLQVKNLNAALKTLSNREKTAFYLFYYEDMKQKEIAKVMDASVSAIESLIFKSKKKIKKFLGNKSPGTIRS